VTKLSPVMKALMMIVAGFLVLILPGVIILLVGRKIENYPGAFALAIQGACIVGLALTLTGAINIVVFLVRSLKRNADQRRA